MRYDYIRKIVENVERSAIYELEITGWFYNLKIRNNITNIKKSKKINFEEKAREGFSKLWE